MKRSAIRSNLRNTDSANSNTSSHQDDKCKECGNVFKNGRWQSPPPAPRSSKAPFLQLVDYTSVGHSVCPSCSKGKEQLPGGIVTLAGDFLSVHLDEILQLIRNEASRASKANPLQRVMLMDVSADNKIKVHTTDARLAQRIGRALHKAYRGEVHYNFNGHDTQTRVEWKRAA